VISIASDDPIVADLLASTLELVGDAGGWLHPDSRLVCREGQFALECDGSLHEPLLHIPREALVRVDAVTWDEDMSALRVDSVPDDIGDVELALLYVQSALHNQVDRLTWIERTHPAVAPLAEDVIQQLRTLVPGFRATLISPRDVLFADRCLQVDLNDGRGTQRVLVPILDLLNHHPAGARADWDGSAFTVSVQRPFGSTECALDYGMDRDALELAAIYGFADETATVAHLPQESCTVAGVGTMRLLAPGRDASGGWPPVEVITDDDGWTISHLSFSTDQRRMLDLVDEVAAAAQSDADTSRSVLAALGREALARTRAFGELCTGEESVLQVLRRAADRQCDVLDSALAELGSA
jgi:hypothetical protein